MDAIYQGKHIVVDRCNFDEAQRSTWIQLGALCPTHHTVLAVQFDIPLEVCQQRAVQRRDHPSLAPDVAPEVIKKFAQSWAWANAREGFDRIANVRNDEELEALYQELAALPPAPVVDRRATLEGSWTNREALGGRGGWGRDCNRGGYADPLVSNSYESPPLARQPHSNGEPWNSGRGRAWQAGTYWSQQRGWGQNAYTEQVNYQWDGRWSQSSWGNSYAAHHSNPPYPHCAYQGNYHPQPARQEPLRVRDSWGSSPWDPEVPGQMYLPRSWGPPARHAGTPPRPAPAPPTGPLPVRDSPYQVIGDSTTATVDQVLREGPSDCAKTPVCSPVVGAELQPCAADTSMTLVEASTVPTRSTAPLVSFKNKPSAPGPRGLPGLAPTAPGCKLDITTGDASVDQKIILLFDLNGTLTSHTSRRRSAGRNRLRPHTKDLLQLHDKFRVGIFTSSTLRTVAHVKQMMEDSVGCSIFEPGLVLYRDHTLPVSQALIKSGCDPWDTVKPLGRWFERVDRVVLVDDDTFKAVPGEEANMVVVPCWMEEDPRCDLIPRLVNALIEVLGTLGTEDDVREHTAAVTRSLVKDIPVVQPDTSENMSCSDSMVKDPNEITLDDDDGDGDGGGDVVGEEVSAVAVH